ncbi:MAG: hypothetical protein OXT49_09425 [Gammaproteobacteria bacterium]|nr:hypothetical protein [Gammaproteobacteria bacterium]
MSPVAAETHLSANTVEAESHHQHHQHHQEKSHEAAGDHAADSHCSQCCHLSLNALAWCGSVTDKTLSPHLGISRYQRRWVTQTPLTPFRPPIA